jgi:hypothetical protein
MTITAPPPPSPWARQVRSAALQASPWRSAGNPYANITASLDNAGTISGTSGRPCPLRAITPAFIDPQPVDRHDRRHGGGHIITNNGTIAGGTLSAIERHHRLRLRHHQHRNDHLVQRGRDHRQLFGHDHQQRQILNTGTGPAITST